MSDKKPIIAFGEFYTEPLKKNVTGGDKKRPYEYGEAREKILNNINTIRESIETKKEIFLDEKILCIRMEPDFEAKSYIPNSFVYKIENTDIVGGRKFKINDKDKSKLYFIRTDVKGINNLYDIINNNSEYNNKSWRNDICSIHSLDLLKPEEKIMGIEDNWKYGNVEIVLHPLNKEYNNMMETFYNIIGIPKDKMRIKHYSNSYTFISLRCSIENIEKIKKYNPLRSIHPLGDIKIINSNVTSNVNINSVSLLEDNKKSSILVGVFDGGINENNRLLKNYSKAYNPIGNPINDKYMQHGTAVCGAILFGNLNNIQNNKIQTPPVSIESYRVLPPNDETDIELYDTIDIIEEVVEENNNIKLFNISFGPSGAIIDDDINRFTYALDKLTYGNSKNDKNFINPLFVVAVGNDGKVNVPEGRFMQFKVTMETSNAESTPVLNSMDFTYVENNLAPEVLNGGLTTRYRQQNDSAETAKSPQLEENEAMVYWKGSDPNGDKLIYDLEYRLKGEKNYRKLANNLETSYYKFNAYLMPSGIYDFRITASDKYDNPVNEIKTKTLEVFNIKYDNDPPEIFDFNVSGEGANRKVTFRVEDKLSFIKTVRYSTITGEWRYIVPDDGLLDSMNETFSIDMKNDAESSSITIEVMDTDGNTKYYSFLI